MPSSKPPASSAAPLRVPPASKTGSRTSSRASSSSLILAEALAALLSWASKERLSTVIRGNGTKSCWGRRPTAVDLIVSTRRLNRVLSHQHGDLTATIEAGATLRTVAGELARHGQWLPLSTSFADATIGGTVAANDSGPLRQRHGTARDLLIGCTWPWRMAIW